MKIGATLLVRDEIDVINFVMKHYTNMIDELIVMDNLSTDGTRDVIAGYATYKNVHIFDIASETYRQKEWITRADKMLINLGCDWIMNIDADEMYSGAVRLYLEEANDYSVNVYYAQGAFYYPTVLDDHREINPFKRLRYHDSWDSKYSNDKAIFKPKGFTGVCQGCHWAFFEEGTYTNTMYSKNSWGWGNPTSDFRLHHFPERSEKQFISKYRGLYSAQKLCNMGAGWRAKNEIWVKGGDEALAKYYHEKVVVPETLISQLYTG